MNAPSTRVENYLAQSDTKTNGDIRPLVSAEMEFRLTRGEQLDEAEFRRRFPELEDSVPILLDHATAAYAKSVARSQTSPPQKQLGDYELREVLGKGGMGIVYRARQRTLNRIVAVKTILSGRLANEDQVDRSIEVESAEALNDLAKLYTEVGGDSGANVEEYLDPALRTLSINCK